MKLIKAITFAMIFQFASLHAHEPNIAHFEFKQTGNILIVKAEFPWTLRAALLKAFPELEQNPTQEKFDRAIFEYFNERIVVKEKSTEVKLNTVAQQQNHSHSVIYELVFGQVQNFEDIIIINTCLFEMYDDQKNFNTIYLPERKLLEIVTEKSHPNFIISNKLID